jgi:uncharacterized protein with GYD domain
VPKYLATVSYSADSAKALLEQGGTARVEASRRAVESVGGTLESFYYAFGADDAYVVVELPDNVTAAAVALTVAATGAITTRMTVLLTPEELDQAAARTVTFTPPGG